MSSAPLRLHRCTLRQLHAIIPRKSTGIVFPYLRRNRWLTNFTVRFPDSIPPTLYNTLRVIKNIRKFFPRPLPIRSSICGESPAGHRRSWPTGSMSPANPSPSRRAPSPSRRRRKLLQTSRLFGISTDYLLKDELERPGEPGGLTPPPQPIPSDEPAPDPRPLRRVSRELAEEYLDRRQRCAPRIALATFLCILSPIPLLLLIGISQDTRFAITEEARRRNRTVRSAGGRGRGAVPVLRRRSTPFWRRSRWRCRRSGVGSSGRWPVCCSVP